MRLVFSFVLTLILVGHISAQISKNCVTPSLTLKGVEEGQVIKGTVAIEATVTGATVSKVTFQLSGPRQIVHTEKIKPYYFFGDVNGVPKGWDTALYPSGKYVLTVVAQTTTGKSYTSRVNLQIDAGIFFDNFERSDLGPDWNGTGWKILNNSLHSDLGGYGRVVTTAAFPDQTYSIETRVVKIGKGTGPSPADNVYLIFGSDGTGTSEYRVAFYGSGELVLQKVASADSGELEKSTLASIQLEADTERSFLLKVTRATDGRISVNIDNGTGYPASPLAEVYDYTYPSLGSIGWGVERESPATLSIDYISVK
jgi:hypothetical protein